MRVPNDGNPRPVRASYTAPHLFGMVGPGNQHRNAALGFSSGIIREAGSGACRVIFRISPRACSRLPLRGTEGQRSGSIPASALRPDSSGPSCSASRSTSSEGRRSLLLDCELLHLATVASLGGAGSHGLHRASCDGGPERPRLQQFVADSPLEGDGFEPSVPRWSGRGHQNHQ
jgi:hypothetical protein